MSSFKSDLDRINQLISVPSLLTEMDLKTQAANTFVRYALANALLMDRKQLDYGPRNISRSGVHGVVVRIGDKEERLLHLFNQGRRRKTVNESIVDTFRDISNYGIIALMLEEKQWPNE